MSGSDTCIMGIDPGLKGAIAFYHPSDPNKISVYDMPVVDGEVDAAGLGRLISVSIPSIAIIERVHSMPRDGVASAFKFGCNYGVPLGVIGALNIPVRKVTPTQWKKHYRLSANKEESRARAIELWPGSDRFGRKKDDGRAEAALIAKYGAMLVRDGIGAAA